MLAEGNVSRSSSFCSAHIKPRTDLKKKKKEKKAIKKQSCKLETLLNTVHHLHMPVKNLFVFLCIITDTEERGYGKKD